MTQRTHGCSLHGLMDLPAYRATALGRAAAKYVHDRLMQLRVAQALDFMWYQALASVSALRTFRDPPAQWRSFSRRDAIPAWGRLYNRLHPGVDIYSVHFVKKMPWCQYFNGHGSRTDCQLPDGSEVSLAVMLPDSLGGSVKYIKGFAFEIRTSFPQDLAAPKQAYVRNMQVVVSHEQRDYREPLISHAELVGEEGFTFVPDFSSVKPPRRGVSMWHHVLGVHSDRIPSILGVASGDAPRSYLPPRVEYVGFARDLEQAFNLLACSLRGRLLAGRTCGGLASPSQGRDVALGLAAESLQAEEHVVDVLLASFHGSFRRGHETPKLLLMTPHNDTHDSVCRHFIGGQVDEAWPDLLQDVLLVHLLMVCTPLLVEAHDAKGKGTCHFPSY